MFSQTSPTLMTHDVEEPEAGEIQGYNPMHANISQIPGLSSITSFSPDDNAQGRRHTVRDTDSDYVKLAKQGGQKGLLWHEPTVAAKPAPYTPPNWFFHPSVDHSKSSLINTVEKKLPGAFQPLEPPFGSDSMTAWERSAGGNTGRKEKNSNGYYNQKDKLLPATQTLEISKFRRMVHDKRPAPVDMSKLLSFGYADEDKPTSQH